MTWYQISLCHSGSPKGHGINKWNAFFRISNNIQKNYGIYELILSTGHMSEKIEEYFGSGKNYGVSITCVKEKDQLGMGGAIKNARDILEKPFLQMAEILFFSRS